MKQIVILLSLLVWAIFTVALGVLIFPVVLLYAETEWFDFPERMINKL